MPVSTWQAATTYALGTLIVDSNGNIEQCTNSGTTGAAAPLWSKNLDDVTSDGTAGWTLRVPANRDTTKLMEEAKLYWTVQSLIAPAVGYLLSHLTFSHKLQDCTFCILAFVPIVVGTVYNIAGAGYIYEARRLSGLPLGRDFFCGWMAWAYLILGGVTFALLGYFVALHFKAPVPDSLFVGFVVGVATVWCIAWGTYRQVQSEFRSKAVAGFENYVNARLLHPLSSGAIGS
jgi:hypothetical protein